MPGPYEAFKALQSAILKGLVVEGGEQFPKIARAFETIKAERPDTTVRNLRVMMQPELPKNILGLNRNAGYQDIPNTVRNQAADAWRDALLGGKGPRQGGIEELLSLDDYLPLEYSLNHRPTVLEFNPRLEKLGYSDVLDTVAHENFHTTQGAFHPNITKDYARQNELVGYRNNPYERDARIAALARALAERKPGVDPLQHMRLASLLERTFHGQGTERIQALWQAIRGKHKVDPSSPLFGMTPTLTPKR